MQKAILYKKLPNKFVQCLACNHYCKIPEENAGICGARQNLAGNLYLLVYGSAVAAHVDPMEKKPLFHFLPSSQIFSFGTIGCNFSCSFCQNADISQQGKELKIKSIKTGKIGSLSLEIKKFGYDLPPQKIVDFCVENKIPSIAYTYNEPTVFFEYAYDAMVLAKKRGIKNIFVSNGYMSKEARKKAGRLIDAVNIDLKSFSEDFYRKVCGARLKPVLENIQEFYKSGAWLEITTLLIPGQNDSKKEIEKIAGFIKSVSADIPWHISRFYPQYKMTRPEITPVKSLETAYKIGKESGLKHVYIGNAQLLGKENTFCPDCGVLLIKRDGYRINVLEENFRKGICAKCKTIIRGIWQ